MLKKKTINPRVIEERIRSRDNFKEFLEHCHKKFFPKESCYNSYYIAQYLQGTKDFIPLSAATAPILKSMKKNSYFEKKELLQIVKNDSKMAKYLPDDIDCSRIQRETLISVSTNFKFRLYIILILV
jgi:hypothetical protein